MIILIPFIDPIRYVILTVTDGHPWRNTYGPDSTENGSRLKLEEGN